MLVAAETSMLQQVRPDHELADPCGTDVKTCAEQEEHRSEPRTGGVRERTSAQSDNQPNNGKEHARRSHERRQEGSVEAVIALPPRQIGGTLAHCPGIV